MVRYKHIDLSPRLLPVGHWLADWFVQQGITFVLGHALHMHALHGGKANNDRTDSEKIARLVKCAKDPAGKKAGWIAHSPAWPQGSNLFGEDSL